MRPPASLRWAARAARSASIWSSHPGPLRAAVRPLAERAREALVRLGDPLLPYRLDGIELELPLSHELPRYRAVHPGYDTALGRVARAVWTAHPGSSVIDIGANVGDTAAVIRSGSPARILAIEGSDAFFPILERNAPRIGDVLPEKAFVAAEPATVAGEVAVARGTARVTTGTGTAGEVVRFERLDAILARHPDLPPPRLVKIDTDGFDCPIVEGGGEFWARWRPVLFFEFDPDFYAPGWSSAAMFGVLRAAGYERALVYENVGELAGSVSLSDRAGLEELQARYSGLRHARYADLCLFHAEDAEAAERFRLGELALARSR